MIDFTMVIIGLSMFGFLCLLLVFYTVLGVIRNMIERIGQEDDWK